MLNLISKLLVLAYSMGDLFYFILLVLKAKILGHLVKASFNGVYFFSVDIWGIIL